jgi:signal transduction histidine kinase/DNA-binding response OmpR family regulator/ligand-binding sensor domain-containing protein
MLRLSIWGLILVLFLSSFKTNKWRHNQIGSAEGLSNSAVTSSYLDSKGYMWFGTWDGLNRFDGSNIKVFKPNTFRKNTINNNIIRNILEDRFDNLWIVTETGLNTYDYEQNTFTSYLDNIDFLEYREESYRASLDLDSIIWCSKYNYGICKYDYENKQFSEPIKISNQEDITKKTVGFAFAAKDQLWCLSEEGNAYKLEHKNTWEITKTIQLSSKYQFNSDKNWFYIYHNQPFLFLSLNNGGLLSVNLEDGTTQKHEPQCIPFSITTLSASLDGEFLWGGTDEGEVFKLDLSESGHITRLENSENKKVKIWSIAQTEPDLLWIGTDGDGVHRYIMEGNFFESIKKGELSKGKLNHDIVRATYEDENGNLWIGTRGNGLNFIPETDAPTKVFDTQNGLSNNAVLSLGTDPFKNIWIGVDGEGIDMFEAKTKKILHFPDDFENTSGIKLGSVYSICLDAFNDLWIGTSGYGLFRLSIVRKKNGNYRLANYRHYKSDPLNKNGLNSNIIYSIVEGEPNILWIGTRGGGLYRLNTISEKSEAFRSNSNDLNSLLNDDVLSLCKPDNENLWIGTSGGLDRLNLTTFPYQFTHYTEQNKLPNNTIHAIQTDQNDNIWVSTNNGLAKLNYKNNQIRSYYYSDGLQSNEFTDGASCFGIKTGNLYFGGVNGLTYFDPNEVTDTKYFPRLAITKFSVFNETEKEKNSDPFYIDMSDSLNLNYDQNFFRFEFTTLNFHNKQKCKYAFKLENFSTDYTIINKEGEATFTNVPPGDYIFRVECTNEDGIWNPETREIKLTIFPPFWKTTWAYISYVIISFMAIFLFIFLLLRRTKTRNKLAIERLEIQKTKEMNHYKFQFFTDIAHEFRTPLTLIMAPAAQLMDLHPNDKEISPYVKSIYNNSTRLLHLIRELIDFRKVETGHFELHVQNYNLTDFTRTITEAFTQYALEKEIHLKLIDNSQDVIGWFDNNILEKILLNLISNALKYTPQQGSVFIELLHQQKNAILKITDTGIGIPTKYQDKIFDRFFQNKNSLPKEKRFSESAGVGLSLTKSLIKLHKGSIQLESKPNIGSCFTISIPISKNEYSNSERENEIVIDENRIKDRAIEEIMGLEVISFTNKATETCANESKKQNILVVDDNEQLRNLIYDILHQDYTVLLAKNGLEALDKINSNDISLIVSDIIMPEMDGLELCNTIKEDINTCHIPVILLTAKGELEHRIEGIESGADSYIPKPFDPRHLKVRIRKLIEMRNQVRDAFQSTPNISVKDVSGLYKRDVKFVDNLQKIVTENLDKTELNADMLADQLAMSKTQLYRKMKAVTGFTPHGFIRNFRLKKAASLLLESSYTVSEIIYETGFNNRTYFYRCFKELYGDSPTDYKKNIIENAMHENS